jgi:tripartite-type tricarboxylate transporter receptor subunit TctC
MMLTINNRYEVVMHTYNKGYLRFAVLIVAALCTGTAVTALAADAWPQRSIRLLIPFPPGGAGDIVGRLLGAKLSTALGQQFVIDNRGGGGQVIATEITAHAPPDGYTLFLASVTHSVNPAFFKKLPYDTVRDFAPITLVADSPLVFVAHPSLNVSTIQELIAAAKARPGQINYGSSGPGSGGHLAVELLKSMAKIDLVHVPYKGAAPALVDLLAGQVKIVSTSPLAALPYVKQGRLRALAMTGSTRSHAAPDIPTVAESGVPGYHTSLWYALLAPARTPAAIITRLHDETVRALRTTDLTDQLYAQGADPVGNTPQELQQFIRSEIERWAKVVREGNIRIE